MIKQLTLGVNTKPASHIKFPAQQISTELKWSDLILEEKTMSNIKDLERWIEHNDELMNDWDMHKKLKPGYRALFYGPPGTGKTLTATLLGKYTQRDVFRVDLSMIVSKYIGETEKNLSSLFDKAANKEWILFFDEADALFGKRTNVRDAHDKYANQEVSYLLQRIESHPGLVILASNIKSNIDEPFTRRFQSITYFPMPNAKERKLLWANSFPEKMKLSSKIDVDDVANQYELAGGSIMNVVQHACLLALEKDKKTIEPEFLYSAIRREFEKEGKLVQ